LNKNKQLQGKRKLGAVIFMMEFIIEKYHEALKKNKLIVYFA